MTSEIISYLLLETETANDFYSSAPTTIYEALWWGATSMDEGDPNVIAFNLPDSYADAGGVPGSPLPKYPSHPNGDDRSDRGPEGPIYEYHASVSVNIGEGSYWFSVQACDHAFPPQWGRLAAGQVTGSQATFRSEYFAYPDWTPSEQIWAFPWTRVRRLTQFLPFPGRVVFVHLHCEFSAPPVDCLQLGGHGRGREHL